MTGRRIKRVGLLLQATYLFVGFKTIILCYVHSIQFMKYVFSAKTWLVKTSIRESWNKNHKSLNQTLVHMWCFLFVFKNRIYQTLRFNGRFHCFTKNLSEYKNCEEKNFLSVVEKKNALCYFVAQQKNTNKWIMKEITFIVNNLRWQ